MEKIEFFQEVVIWDVPYGGCSSGEPMRRDMFLIGGVL